MGEETEEVSTGIHISATLRIGPSSRCVRGVSEGYVHCCLLPPCAKSACPKAMAAAHAALEIDPILPKREHAGGIMSYYYWDLSKAKKTPPAIALIQNTQGRAGSLRESHHSEALFEEA